MPLLYFIEGLTPTAKEFEVAAQYLGKGPLVKFVSLVNLDLNGPMLKFSAVRGAVPEQYKPKTETVVVETKWREPLVTSKPAKK